MCSVAGGELFERIVDDSYDHTEVSSVGYMHQILEGVQYMHQQNIVHLDLKPENIVCVDRTGIQIKVIDFGLASKLGEYFYSINNIFESSTVLLQCTLIRDLRVERVTVCM